MAFAKASESTFGIAKLVGEGFGRPNAIDESPIDIQYGKLAEWLGTRKHLPVDWRKRLRAIQAATSKEAQALPPQLSTDEALDFFTIQKIRDSLAEDADKGLFGGLKGAAGTWDKLVKAYEKQNIHLGEAGTTLMRNVDFEIPYFKKQAEKLQQQIADHEHRHEEYLRNADTASRDFKEECSQLGIQGSNIAQELAQLQYQLPSMYAEALETVNDAAITHAMQHYATFTAYAHSSAASNAEPLTASQLLPKLESIRKLHTTTASATASQLHEGLASTDRQQASTEGDSQQQSEGPVDIDWDVSADAEPSADAESGAAAESGALAESSAESALDANAAVDIDWDVVIQPNEAATEQSQPETDAQGTNIDWDIDMTETAQENGGGATPSGVPPVDNRGNEGTDGSTQQQQWPESAVQLSQDSNSRTSLLDDLYELKSFLLQQTQELSSGNHDSLAASTFDAEQTTSLTDIQSQLAVVKQLLDKLTHDTVQQLVMIKTSKQYLARLERALKQKSGQHDKFLRLAEELKRKQEEHERGLKGNAIKLQSLVQQTRQIKVFVEQAISTLYDNRTVHIIGDINKVV